MMRGICWVKVRVLEGGEYDKSAARCENMSLKGLVPD